MQMRLSATSVRTFRSLWTATFSVFLFLNLDQFAYSAGFGPEPKYWLVGIFLVTLAAFLPRVRLAVILRKPIVGWLSAYLFISIVWMGHAENLEFALDGMVMVLVTSLLVLTGLLAYPSISAGDRIWKVALWFALCFAVLSVAQEYLNPLAYVFSEVGQGIQGRAAGVYLNPNIAAQAIIMILACLMAQGSRRENVLALLLSVIGVLLTFSRGGLFAWGVLVVAASFSSRLPRWFLAVIAICIGLILLMGPMVLEWASAWISPEHRNSIDRLAWLLGQGTLGDYSAGERESIAAYAWQEFLSAPLIGHGLGYMWAWTADVGTHNVILRFLVEYGVIGVLIFPLFLFASVRSSDHPVRFWGWTVAVVACVLSIFNHNITEQANFLLPWLALCLVSGDSGVRDEQK